MKLVKLIECKQFLLNTMKIAKKKNTFYINIADFLIEINFIQLNPKSKMQDFMRNLNPLIEGYKFTLGKKIKTVDFIIDIKPTIASMFFDKTKDAFIKLYMASDNPDRITSFYSISMDQFQFILMKILFWLLINKGFIVHCSAIKIQDQAVLFIGKQGAGKSTVVNLLSNEYEVLADDNGIIKEEAGRYYFYQSPKYEKNLRIKKTGKRYLIKAVFLLKKSPVYKIKKIIDKEFLLKKVSHQFWGDPTSLKQQIKFLFKMVNSFNNFYFLYFSKNKEKLKQLINNENI